LHPDPPRGMVEYGTIRQPEEVAEMTGVWIAVVVISAIIVGITIWVTNKAYSKKWEE